MNQEPPNLGNLLTKVITFVDKLLKYGTMVDGYDLHTDKKKIISLHPCTR